MKQAIILFLAIIKMTISISQSSISIGPTLSFGQNFTKSVDVGLGGEIEYINKFSSHIGGRACLGYTLFKGNQYANDKTSFLPIRVGIQAFLSDLIFFYSDAGVAVFKDNTYNQVNFSYGLGSGYQAPFGSKQQFIQISASYNSVVVWKNSPHRWFNVKVAYGFGMGKKSKGNEN